MKVYFRNGPLFKTIVDKVSSMYSDTDQDILFNIIKLCMKSVVKDILFNVVLSRTEDYASESAKEDHTDQHTDTE